MILLCHPPSLALAARLHVGAKKISDRAGILKQAFNATELSATMQYWRGGFDPYGS